MLGSQPILFHLMLKQGFNWFHANSRYTGERYCLNKTKILLFQKMAREISPVGDFIFGSLCTCLLTNMVDVELTIKMVKEIYTYHKDHMAESTIFSPWSMGVIHFPSLRCKIQAFQDDSSKQMMTWNSGMIPQFSAPPRPHRSLRKHAPGKTRTRWSNHNHQFNPIRTNRYNTHDAEPNDMK